MNAEEAEVHALLLPTIAKKRKREQFDDQVISPPFSGFSRSSLTLLACVAPTGYRAPFYEPRYGHAAFESASHAPSHRNCRIFWLRDSNLVFLPVSRRGINLYPTIYPSR